MKITRIEATSHRVPAKVPLCTSRSYARLCSFGWRLTAG